MKYAIEVNHNNATVIEYDYEENNGTEAKNFRYGRP